MVSINRKSRVIHIIPRSPVQMLGHVNRITNCLFAGDLTDLRSALVSNKTFAMIVVRSGLHRFLKHADPRLMQLIPEFSALMTEEAEDQDHAIAQVGLLQLCFEEQVERGNSR